MRKINVKFSLGILLFIIGILSALLAKFAPNTKGFLWIILLVSIVYLFAGWYLFKGYYPEGHFLLLFLIGYLYAGVFITIVFIGFDLPLVKTFVVASILWIITQILILLICRKRIPKMGFIQFAIEVFFLLIIVLYSVLNYL